MSAIVKRVSALILEDKVSDLQSQLASASHALASKDTVVRFQQEKLRNIEAKCKQCLDNAANATCAHKKALNDLENVKIILKSYEQHVETNNFDCQVNLESNSESIINEILLKDVANINHIIQHLQNDDRSKVCISDLQQIARNLANISHMDSTVQETCEDTQKSQTAFSGYQSQLKAFLTQCEIQIDSMENLIQHQSILSFEINTILQNYNENQMEIENYRKDMLSMQKELEEMHNLSLVRQFTRSSSSQYDSKPLTSSEQQTTQEENFLEQQLATMTTELSRSQAIIDSLQIQIDSYSLHSDSIRDLKELYQNLQVDTIALQKNVFCEQIQNLEKKLEEVKQSRKQSHEQSTQVDIKRETEHTENKQLIQQINKLKTQLESQETTRNSINNELNAIKLESNQNCTEISNLKKENDFLRQQLAKIEEIDNIKTSNINIARGLRISRSESCLNDVESKEWLQNFVKTIKYVSHSITCMQTAVEQDERSTESLKEKDVATLTASDDFLGEDSISCNCLLELIHKLQQLPELDEEKRNLIMQNEELIQCLKEYNIMNKTLLQSNCDLETDKNRIIQEHESLLGEFIELQNSQKSCIADQGVNTVYSSDSEKDYLKTKNLDLHCQNLRYRKDINHLLSLIDDQASEKSCKQCETSSKMLHSQELHLEQMTSEKKLLLAQIEQRDIKITSLQQRCEENSVALQKCKDDAHDVNLQLKSGRKEQDELRKDVDNANSRCACLTRDLQAAKDEIKSLMDCADHKFAIAQYQQTIAKLQEKSTKLEFDNHMLFVKLTEKEDIIKQNEKVLSNYSCLECELTNNKELKNNLEHDFSNYIRTSTLLQQKIDDHNKNLIVEITALQKENKCMKSQIHALNGKLLFHTQQLSKSECECNGYRCRLEEVLKVLEQQKREFAGFESNMNYTKQQMESELKSLKNRMDLSTYDINQVLSSKDKSPSIHLAELHAFVDQRDLEIGVFMDQKQRAMDIIKTYFNGELRGRKTLHKATKRTQPSNARGKEKNRSKSVPVKDKVAVYGHKMQIRSKK